MTDYYVDASLASNGTGTQGDPFNTVQSAFDVIAAGDNIYATGTETVTSTLSTGGVDATADNRIGWYGCDSSWNVGNAQFILDGTSYGADILNAGGEYWDISNITIKGGLQCVDLEGDYMTGSHWHECIFENASASGFDGYRGGDMMFTFCVFRNNGSNGLTSIYSAGDTTFLFCRFENNTNAGDREYYQGHNYVGCLFVGNGTGVELGESSLVVNCVFDDNGIGLEFGDVDTIAAVGSRFTNNSTYAISTEGASNYRGWLYYSAFYNNTTKLNGVLMADVGSVDMASGGYEDQANGDYDLSSSAEARSIAVDLFWDS
jgi:hypothetical protein